MIDNRRISKIIIVIVALAVALCFVAIAFADKISDSLGGFAVSMAYESRLFDTDEIIQIDIQMDEDDWQNMLANATAEEFVPCDVVINGTRINNVGIRPKGNTSLSSIAMDPTTDRYSFKLEFDQYVKGQTCFGLDKLILNNNYADATNMKEAIIYDMYQYIGADSSLYNYAVISINGVYWGVYLALEAVEDSFLLRNFGTQSGEMYKPDSMDMGDRDNGDSNGGEIPDGEFPGPGESDGDSGGSRGDSGDDSAEAADGAANETAAAPQPEAVEEAAVNETAAAPQPETAEETTVSAPDMTETADNNGESSGESNGESENGESAAGEFNFDPDNMPEMGDFPGGGGPGGGGANLNYIDDDLNSYSTIWEGEVTGTSQADHRRVVTALKNISEGNNLETYMDVDNLLRYMAVHTFAVNGDSLSGSMAHNYYLYEYNGQLNMFPWDYNLSFGGMNMGGGPGNSDNSDGASGMINDPIDSPFSGTRFFDKLLENETYLEIYHGYLRELVDNYVFGGEFDKVYQRIRSQIDSLVETDPTAFYNYEEYQAGAEMLYQTIRLRAESIEGQLDGIIPSTENEQRQDSSARIDSSEIDIDTMGTFGMGGGDSDGGPGGSEGFPGFGEVPDGNGAEINSEAAAPEGAEISSEAAAPESTENNSETVVNNTIEDENIAAASADQEEIREIPNGFPGIPATTGNAAKNRNLIIVSISLGIAVLAIAGVLLFMRRKR